MPEEAGRKESQLQRPISKWAERGGGITISGETVERFANIFKKKPKEGLSPAQEKTRRVKRNSRIISTTVIGGTALAVAAQAMKGLFEGHQEKKVIEQTPNVLGEPGDTQEEITQNQYVDYTYRQIGEIGLERTGINLENLSKPETLIDKPFLRLAAKFGDDFLAPPVVDSNGKVVQGVSEAVVGNWVNALNLNQSEEADFRQNYVFYQTHSREFGQFLLKHGASPTVVNFLLKAEELKIQDTDPASWFGGPGNPPDRYEELQEWLKGNDIIIGKIDGKMGLPKVVKVKWMNEVKIPKAGYFNEIAGKVDVETGGVVGQVLGPMETLINMPIDTTAMHEAVAVDMAEFCQYESQKPLLANTGLLLVLTGLFLLRIGPSWPREVIAKASERLEDVYYWIKLGQSERAIRDLAVLGKQVWQRVTGKKI